MKALVLSGRVIDVAAQEFPVAPPMVWIACPEMTQIGWDVVGEQVIVPAEQPPLSLSAAQTLRLKELESYRYQRECAGFNYYGITILTDDRSKTLLAGARTAAERAVKSGESYQIDWKGLNGWVSVDASMIIAISDAVAAYVQACFSKERFHSNVILTLPTVDAVLSYDFTTNWPS